MTQQEYIAQNALGYEGDSFIGKEIAKLVKKFKVNHIVETGTYLGNTTKKLAELAPVDTVEINPINFRQAKKNLEGLENVQLCMSNSVDFLKVALPDCADKSLLCFLDAHWNDYCPLLDELAEIAKAGLRPVIVIHDFKVPNRPDLGFDSYKGQDYTFEWIHDSIYAIYGEDGYSFHYNDKAEGAKRGVIYIYPKEA